MWVSFCTRSLVSIYFKSKDDFVEYEDRIVELKIAAFALLLPFFNDLCR